MHRINIRQPSDSFLREEIRSGYTVSAKMKKIWSVEIDLLQKLLDVCERHHLKCWASSGTLLGAVRHQGFIPWDDDADMTMLRADYDKLVNLAATGQEFKYPYLLQTAYTDKNYVRGHAQLRDMRTTGILPGDIFQNFNMGIFIDIFVYDAVSDDPQFLERQLQEAGVLRKKMWDMYYSGNPYMGIEEDSAHIPLFKRYEEIFRQVSTSESEYFGALAFNLNPVKKRAKAWYAETVLMDFEYIKIPAPSGYDKVLQGLYGDYMQPRQELSLHGKVIFDTERPSDEVLKEFRLDRLKSTERRVRLLEGRCDSLEQQIIAQRTEIAALSGQIASLDTDLSEQVTFFDASISERVNSLESDILARVSSLEAELSERTLKKMLRKSLKIRLNRLVTPLFPYGSRRRRLLRKLYRKSRGWKD
jgi:lipopolysaccharide cholinephosphotransferase